MGYDFTDDPNVVFIENQKTPQELEEAEQQRVLEEQVHELQEFLKEHAPVEDGVYSREFMIAEHELENITQQTPCPLSREEIWKMKLDKSIPPKRKFKSWDPEWRRQQYREKIREKAAEPPKTERIPQTPEEKKADEIKTALHNVQDILIDLTHQTERQYTEKFISFNYHTKFHLLQPITAQMIDYCIGSNHAKNIVGLCAAVVRLEHASSVRSELLNLLLFGTQDIFNEQNQTSRIQLSRMEKQEITEWKSKREGTITLLAELYRNETTRKVLVKRCALRLIQLAYPNEMKHFDQEFVKDTLQFIGITKDVLDGDLATEVWDRWVPRVRENFTVLSGDNRKLFRGLCPPKKGAGPPSASRTNPVPKAGPPPSRTVQQPVRPKGAGPVAPPTSAVPSKRIPVNTISRAREPEGPKGPKAPSPSGFAAPIAVRPQRKSSVPQDPAPVPAPAPIARNSTSSTSPPGLHIPQSSFDAISSPLGSPTLAPPPGVAPPPGIAPPPGVAPPPGLAFFNGPPGLGYFEGQPVFQAPPGLGAPPGIAAPPPGLAGPPIFQGPPPGIMAQQQPLVKPKMSFGRQ
ncbi:unnamed protein product [Caenorhabditis brenneri]